MAIFIICINIGYYVTGFFGIFGPSTGKYASLSLLTNPIFTDLPGFDIIKNIPVVGGLVAGMTGVHLLAVLMMIGTVVLFNTTIISDRGIAIVAFSFIFWVSVFMVGATTFSSFPNIETTGLEVFYGIFVLLCTLIFINALIQMSAGGQKAHV